MVTSSNQRLGTLRPQAAAPFSALHMHQAANKDVEHGCRCRVCAASNVKVTSNYPRRQRLFLRKAPAESHII